jgi:hypothetical protein
LGCNDLNRWEISFTGSDAINATCSPTGFENYLANIHPGDIFKELDSIKRQLLAQTPRAQSHLRVKNSAHQWIAVVSQKQFSYCPANGELRELDISIYYAPSL